MKMITESSLNAFCKKLNRGDSLQNCHFPQRDFHKSSIISRDSQHTPAVDPAATVAFLIKKKGRVAGIDVNEGDFFPGLNNSPGHLQFHFPAVAFGQAGCFSPHHSCCSVIRLMFQREKSPTRAHFPGLAAKESPAKLGPKAPAPFLKAQSDLSDAPR